MSKKITLILFIVFPLMLMLTDCRCQKRTLVIRSVVLQMPEGGSALTKPDDREKLGALVRASMEKNPHYYFNPDDQDGSVLRLMLTAPIQKNSSLMLVGTLSQSENEVKKEYRVFSDVQTEQGAITGKELSVAMSKILEDLYNVASGTASDNDIYLDKVNASLRGEDIDGGELMNAVAVLGEARDQKAVPSLIKLLSATDDLGVGNACLIALGELAPPEAMSPIIEYAELKPPIIRRQAIIAAKNIASKLSAEWLLVMAYGHDDPAVQKDAQVALKEVEEKLGMTTP